MYAEHAGQPADNEQRLSRQERQKKKTNSQKPFEAGSAFLTGISDSDELYPSIGM